MKQLLIALAVTAAFVAAGRDEGNTGSNQVDVNGQVFSTAIDARPDSVSDQQYGRPAASNVQETETLYRLGRPVTYENLTVYPIIYGGQDQQRGADYATLGEAMENGWIEIVEMPEGRQVSQVTIKYTGKKPLLLLAGELLLGGQQDRIVAEDTVIDPLSTVVVKVYCVERGRWSGRTMSFGYAGTQVPTNVKEQAILAGQSQVWDRTGDFNAQAATGARALRSSGYTLGGATGGGGGGFGGGAGGLSGYEVASASTLAAGLKVADVGEFARVGKAELSSVLTGESPVVGMIFVVSGEIKMMELFGESGQLVSSYDPILGGVLALAAVTVGDDWSEPTQEKLNEFLTAAIAAKDKTSNSFLTGVGKTAITVTGPGVRGSVIGGGDKEGIRATHGCFFPDKQGSGSGTGGGTTGGGTTSGGTTGGGTGGGGGTAHGY